MADENASKANGLGSAATLMIEALDKASAELDKTVTSSIEQLNIFNETLEKSFSNRLHKLAEKAVGAVDSSVEDLVIRKEDFAERLADLERAEIETVVLAAREVRQQLSTRAQQATDAVSRLIEEQMTQLRGLTERPEIKLVEMSQTRIQEVGALVQDGKGKIEAQESEYEKQISNRVQTFDEKVQGVVSDGKRELEEKLETYHQDFEEKIADVMDRLSKLVTVTIKDLEEKTNAGSDAVLKFSVSAQNNLSTHVDDWQDTLSSVSQQYQKALSNDKNLSEELHSVKLTQKVVEVKEEINKIAQDASTKLTASHKLFYSSLKRLEKKYYDRLERLFARFETALSQESRLTTGANAYRPQSNHELREILRARLQARGVEIVKGFRRQVEQFESEYSRASAGSHERLETVRATTIDQLEKQVRSMSMELGRVLRSFRNELGESSAQLPQIDDAGHAAALAVRAYRNAMLSFGTD
jgi:chaperonin cofactor prefoldin